MFGMAGYHITFRSGKEDASKSIYITSKYNQDSGYIMKWKGGCQDFQQVHLMKYNEFFLIFVYLSL